MNADQLLAHYEQVADAPDVIPRLRRFILDIAVRGKLVEQDPADEPASELLERIARETSEQTRLPKSWRRARVGTLLDFQYGKGLKASERLDEGPIPVFGSNGIVGFTDEPLTVRPSIIVGRKGSAGALNLCDRPSWTTDVAYFVEAPSFFTIRFLANALAALDLDKLGKGVKPGLSRSDAYEKILNVPPLAEQHRIVAKVDELMALCDQLEAARAEREATRDRLTAASLVRLDAPDPDPATFRVHAAFALENLAPLTTRLDQIKALRQTILNLAVRGKLVEQDPEEEPASELLKRIGAEKARLMKAREIKKPKPSLSIDEPPFDLPANWCWALLGEISAYIQRGKSPKYTAADGSPVVSQKCVQWDGLDLTVAKLVTLESLEKYDQIRVLRDGDLLWNSTGTGTIGRVIRLLRPQPKLVCDSHVTVVRCLLADPEYVRTWLRTDYVYGVIEERAAGSTNQVELTAQMANGQPVPLPPLAEQHRIAAKVDELMALCDRLKASLATSDDTRRRTLDALLHDALAPASREMEAAE